jgi:hypothetical protein
MLSPTPDSLSGGYAPSEPARPKSANRQHASGERSTHKIKGPHRNDFIMAAKTDALYQP